MRSSERPNGGWEEELLAKPLYSPKQASLQVRLKNKVKGANDVEVGIVKVALSDFSDEAGTPLPPAAKATWYEIQRDDGGKGGEMQLRITLELQKSQSGNLVSKGLFGF